MSSHAEPEAGPACPPPAGSKIWLFSILLATLLVYGATLAFDFVYDDYNQIQINPWLQSLSGLRDVFTHHSWAFDPHQPPKYYRPLLLVWFWVNNAWFGLRPSPWHGTTVLAHLLACVLVWQVARRMTNNDRIAACTTALFALHPVHVESVAWISGVNDPLLAVFLLGSWWCYLRSLEGAPWARVASWLLFACGLLTKEVAVLYPAVLLLDRWLRRSDNSGRARWLDGVRILFPYALIWLFYFVLRISVIGMFTASSDQQSYLSSFLSIPWLALFYLRLLVWPFNYNPFYELGPLEHVGWAFWISLLALLGIAVAFVVWYRRTADPNILIAGAWTLFPLMPALWLRFVNEGDIVHDRYLYLSCFGFSLLSAQLWQTLMDRWRIHRTVRIGAGIGICVLLGLLTAIQTAYWKNNFTLYRRSIALAPNNEKPYVNLGIVYANHGMWAQAADTYRALDRLHPDSHRVVISLAAMEYNSGDASAAERDLRRAIAINPKRAEDHYLLSVILAQRNDLPAAIDSARRAVQLEPNNPQFARALQGLEERAPKAAAPVKK